MYQPRIEEKLDSWELFLIQKYGIPGPTNDFDAYNQYPEFRWIYDKYKFFRFANPDSLCSIQFINKMVDYYVKPRFNLSGLGRNARPSQGDERIPFGYVAQQMAFGPHYSIDFDNTETTVYRGRKFAGSSKFYLWQRDTRLDLHSDTMRRVRSLAFGPDWPRYWNFEMVGKLAIEAHLRPSVQFWSKPKYSLVIHACQNIARQNEMLWLPREIHDAFLLPESEDTRRLIVNGDCLRTCYEYAMMLLS